ncbi:MAG: hypothetical protein KAT65_12835 [Methanophagales archaeon]|jgi:hypothetical protein|nr:hypothetical protein [Methanophagales archaeon]
MEERFGYVIKVGGKVVWEGRNPKQKFDEIKQQNPGKRVSIAWRTREKVLVC